MPQQVQLQRHRQWLPWHRLRLRLLTLIETARQHIPNRLTRYIKSFYPHQVSSFDLKLVLKFSTRNPSGTVVLQNQDEYQITK
jgi:hypothetical protein